MGSSLGILRLTNGESDKSCHQRPAHSAQAPPQDVAAANCGGRRSQAISR